MNASSSYRRQARHAGAHATGIAEPLANAPRRVLVFSPDLLPYDGLPTVGSGLRAWGLGQGLRSRGHEVIFSMPRAAIEATKIQAPPDVEALAWSRMQDVLERVAPDVAIICGWPTAAGLGLNRSSRVPVIVDQHGPHMLERAHQGFGTTKMNAREKVAALRKADFFTCAGERQLAYFQRWLSDAGWTDQERLTRAASTPFSVSPDLPSRSPSAELVFVYGGVWLPWQDPSTGLLTVVEALEERGAGSLHLYGGKHPWLPIDSGLFAPLMAKLERSEHVVQKDTVPHSELIAQYTRAHVAIDLMKRNRERELAFTSRTVEYLWCGLPVIYNDYSELSGLIRDFDAGWTLDPEDVDGLRAVLAEIFDTPDRLAQMSENARRLARERLAWDVTIEPIDGMVRTATIRRAPAPGMRVRHGLDVLVWESAKARDAYRRGGVSLVARKIRGRLSRRRVTTGE